MLVQCEVGKQSGQKQQCCAQTLDGMKRAMSQSSGASVRGWHLEFPAGWHAAPAGVSGLLVPSSTAKFKGADVTSSGISLRAWQSLSCKSIVQL